MSGLLEAIIGGIQENIAAKLEPKNQVDLADVIWQQLDPVSYNAMLVEGVKMKNPKIGHPDIVPNLEDRLFYKSPGYIDALFKRDEEFRANANWNQGRMTTEELNRATEASRAGLDAARMKKNRGLL